MLKNILKLKALLSLVLIVAFSISTMGSIVSDNDGAAFVTKAEFEALKESFSEQINKYNDSIDAKIDGAVAAYLAGKKLQTKEELDVADWKKSIYFYNYPNFPISIHASSGSKYYASLSNWGASVHPTSYNELLVASNKWKWSGWGSGTPLIQSEARMGSWTNTYAISFWPKLMCQDDNNEFWYMQWAFSCSNLYNSLASYSKQKVWTQLWAVNNSLGKINNILYDLMPGRKIMYGQAYGYNSWNIAPNQPAWQLADIGNTSSGLSNLNRTGLTFTHGNISDSWIYAVQGSRDDGVSAWGQWSYNIDDYQYLSGASLILSAASSYSGNGLSNISMSWYIYATSCMKLSIRNALYCDITNESVLCVSPWGADNFDADKNGFRAFHWKIPGYSVSKTTGYQIIASAIGISNRDHNWSMTHNYITYTTRLNFGMPTSQLYLKSMNNYLAATNGEEVGMMDGLPLFYTSQDGYVHLEMETDVYSYQSRASWSSTTMVSVFLYLNNTKFPYTPWDSTQLYLCDEKGDITTSIAKSIQPINGTYSFDIYIPVKSNQTIYAKLQTNDKFGLARVRIKEIKATLLTD